MDITPVVEEHIHLIDGYGVDGIRVAQQCYTQPIIVFPDHVVPLDVSCTIESLHDSVTYQPMLQKGVSVALIGAGSGSVLLPSALRQEMQQHGITLDVMDTGAACRTYNVLVAESRPVCALLLPVR